MLISLSLWGTLAGALCFFTGVIFTMEESTLSINSEEPG